MTTIEIPQRPSEPGKDPLHLNPDPERTIGDPPKPIETTASKKVDDLSRHESKHSQDPKQEPKQNARDKTVDPSRPGSGQKQGGPPVPPSPKH